MLDGSAELFFASIRLAGGKGREERQPSGGPLVEVPSDSEESSVTMRVALKMPVMTH